MDEVAGFEPRDLRHHLQQQGIGGDVERYAKEDVGTALVELQAQAAVGNVELEEGMTRRKVHVVEVGYVPGTDNDAAGVRIVADGLHGFADLVDESTLIVGPGTPLITVDMSQVTVFVRPFVPDAHAVVLQVFGVRVTF